MAHTGNFWIYDAEAVAAVNAAGVTALSGKTLRTVNGLMRSVRSHPTSAPIESNQIGEGCLFTAQYHDLDKFKIDKDGNIALVGKVDGVDVSGLKPLSVPPGDFLPEDDTIDYVCSGGDLRNGTTLTEQTFHAPVYLPHGATVTKLTLYGYRSTAGSLLEVALRRISRIATQDNMAYVAADWTDGMGNKFDDTIDLAVIDNENYAYNLLLTIDPDASVIDCYFINALIDWS